MTPTELHETLDRSGWLDDAHGSGTYALEVPTPNAVEAVQRAWLNAHGTPLPDAYAEQLATCGSDDHIVRGSVQE